jgi:hypothetical protein
MQTIAFAVPPPSLLPDNLVHTMLDPEIALMSAQKDPKPAEGISVAWACQKTANAEAPAPNPRAEPTLEDSDDDVLEVQLSTPAAPQLETLTVKQMRAYAAQKGVSLQGLVTKKQILQKLKA